jgi:hypothetical protein
MSLPAPDSARKRADRYAEFNPAHAAVGPRGRITPNTLIVIAVDSAGNESCTASMTNP